MKGKTLMTVLAGMGMWASTCEESFVSKRDLCEKVGNAYCARETALGCDQVDSSCISEECGNYFVDYCQATAEEVQKANHDIEMIINTKTDCESLRSIDEYLLQDIDAMANSECANAATAKFTGLGQMCAEMIGKSCENIIRLGCYQVSQEQCETYLYDGGEFMIGNGYSCTTPDDATVPTAIQMVIVEESLKAIAAVDSCN